MDIVTGIAALTQALDIAKKLREFGQTFDEAEFKLKIAELYSALADAKMSLADSKQQLEEKDAEIDRLKRTFQNRADCIIINDLKYEKGQDGRPTGRPYCPRCDEVDGRLIKLRQKYEPDRGNVQYCPECERPYEV